VLLNINLCWWHRDVPLGQSGGPAGLCLSAVTKRSPDIARQFGKSEMQPILVDMSSLVIRNYFWSGAGALRRHWSSKAGYRDPKFKLMQNPIGRTKPWPHTIRIHSEIRAILCRDSIREDAHESECHDSLRTGCGAA
jgi:hypothetical protein